MYFTTVDANPWIVLGRANQILFPEEKKLWRQPDETLSRSLSLPEDTSGFFYSVFNCATASHTQKNPKNIPALNKFGITIANQLAMTNKLTTFCELLSAQ